MSGPGAKRKGAARTRSFVASQNIEANEDDTRNSTGDSLRQLKRRIVTSSSPPRSPVTRSQGRSAQPSPARRHNMSLSNSPNRDRGSPRTMRTTISESIERTNDTVVGDNSGEQEEGDSRMTSNADEASKGSGTREFG